MTSPSLSASPTGRASPLSKPTNLSIHPLITAAWLLALVLPLTLAWQQLPLATFWNQVLAGAGWGAVLAAGAAAWRLPLRQVSPAAWGLAVWLLLAALSPLLGLRSVAQALPMVMMLAAALLLLLWAQGLAASSAARLAQGFACAWVVVGLLSVAAAGLQFFAPHLVDGTNLVMPRQFWGRATGYLHQPNLLASILLAALLAGVALVEIRKPRPARRWVLPLWLTLMILGVLFSGSRMGLLGLALPFLWGLADRSLRPATRRWLWAIPLLTGLLWLALSLWAATFGHAFGFQERLANEGVAGSSRPIVWRHSLHLLAAEPVTGVGLGEFQRAWTLTPFADRPQELFGHAHNLPLHVLVEMGWSQGLVVLGLLAAGVALALVRAWRAQGEDATLRRFAVMLVLVYAWHSLLEYPLWHLNLLLPTVWALGFATRPLDGSPATPARAARWAWAAIGMTMVAVAALTAWDYQRVARLYAHDGDTQRTGRMADARQSVLFASLADYAFATNTAPSIYTLAAAWNSSHDQIDAKLLQAWAESLAATGEVDKARHIAARLREFNFAQTRPWFAPCATAPAEAQPFQCTPPQQTYSHREF
ncbi:MAG: Wzy polymerase domain-containing protein [Proteobacteria bacterium]|nr:Wzy polymerase domain-containing protein [Pseudomonadota bacterium]